MAVSLACRPALAKPSQRMRLARAAPRHCNAAGDASASAPPQIAVSTVRSRPPRAVMMRSDRAARERAPLSPASWLATLLPRAFWWLDQARAPP